MGKWGKERKKGKKEKEQGKEISKMEICRRKKQRK